MPHATRPPKNCPDCNTEIPSNRKRCEGCAYQARLDSNLRRYHANSNTPRERTCQCGKVIPHRGGPTKYCDDCRKAAQLQSKKGYRERKSVPRAPMSRPCPTCGTSVPRRGKVYAKFCSDGCKPVCVSPDCSRPYKYRVSVGPVCPRDYARWKANGTFTTRWEWATDPGNCRQCGKEMPSPILMLGWICSARCHGRRRLKIDESQTWQCAGCQSDISRSEFRSDAKLCRICRTSRRPALSAHQLARRDGSACALCDLDVDMSLSGMDYWGPTADHKIPVSGGGSDVPENLQLAHRICNILKSDRIDSLECT